MHRLTCLFLVGLVCASAASAAPLYNIVKLGLDDAEHTRNDGYKSSSAGQMFEAGQVYGSSARYNGGNTQLGNSLWAYNGATTIEIGLTGPEHIRNDGYQDNVVHETNKAGQIRGYAFRYNGGSADLGYSIWFYDGATTIQLGFTGSEHTGGDGYKFSFASDLNETGQVVGYSNRYNGDGAFLRLDAWLYDGTTTIDIGLTGSEHTRNDGYKISEPRGLTDAGQVVGYSTRYNGSSADLGQSAWLYNGTTTIDIGLTDSEHTRSDGYKNSGPYSLNQAGYFGGYSTRYNGGSTDLGQTTWLYDGTTTIDIGLTGSEHTRNDGYKVSGAGRLNEAGQVSGASTRYNGGSTDLGFSAWLYNGATTIDIGLTGAEHTRNDGYKVSQQEQLNEAGQVGGYSYRYNGGSTFLGYSAWLYNGAITIDIGLTGAEHTRNDGYKFSRPNNINFNHLNEAGQVSGHSTRFIGGNDAGESAWLFNGTTTIELGFTGPEHTRSNGYKYSEAQQLNEAGQVIGRSERYNSGSALLAQSAWLYDGTTMIELGFTGPEHTRNNGHKYSNASDLNEAGQVIGRSQRYNGNTFLGFSSWLYDPVLGQTIPLQLSMRSDGFALSSPAYLGEDGLVFGSYTLFDALDNNLGSRAFYFTIAGGLHDLGSLVDGGLAAGGWDSLANAIRANGLGQILGAGKLTSQSAGQMAYLLTPIVPEPASLTLIAFGLPLSFASARHLRVAKKTVEFGHPTC